MVYTIVGKYWFDRNNTDGNGVAIASWYVFELPEHAMEALSLAGENWVAIEIDCDWDNLPGDLIQYGYQTRLLNRTAPMRRLIGVDQAAYQDGPEG